MLVSVMACFDIVYLDLYFVHIYKASLLVKGLFLDWYLLTLYYLL